MSEHAPWIGSDYPQGISGQRVAIVGWSHWGDESDEDFGTVECISRVVSGEWRISFFTKIRNYFGYDNHDAFWRRVMFFNYLPTLVGGGEQRFGHGTQEQRTAAQERFKRLICEQVPHKVLVFTSRRWAFPATNDQEILGADFPQFERRKYGEGLEKTTVFFLRHPQGASGDIMQRAVTHVLTM